MDNLTMLKDAQARYQVWRQERAIMAEMERIEIEQGYVIKQSTRKLADGTTVIISNDDYGASAEIKINGQSLVFGLDASIIDELSRMTTAEILARIKGDRLC